MLTNTEIKLKDGKLVVCTEIWGDRVDLEFTPYADHEDPVINSAITSAMVLNGVSEVLAEKTVEKFKKAGWLE